MDLLCPSRTEQCNLFSVGDLARTNKISLTPEQKDRDLQMLSAVSRLTKAFEVMTVPEETFYMQHLDTASSPWLNWILINFSARTPKVLLISFLIHLISAWLHPHILQPVYIYLVWTFACKEIFLSFPFF